MQRIPQLPPWNLTNPLPAFHDYESLSAIDQTARLYGAMRGLIDDYNKFANSVNETIINYHNDLNADQEQFKNEINQLVHDYIIALDAKIAHQDRVIEENITYIKENLSTAVEDFIAQMKESGELSEAIGDSFNALGERIQTLESAVAELNAFKTNAEIRFQTIETKTTQLEVEAEKAEETTRKVENIYKNNVSDMLQASELKEGDVVRTLGYYKENDGGGALYKIKIKDTEDNIAGFTHTLQNNLIAEMIIENNRINIKQLGARSQDKENNKYDIKPYIELYLSKLDKITERLKLFIPAGVWYCSGIEIVREYGFVIEGDESWQTYASGGTTITSYNDNQSYIFKIGNTEKMTNNFSLRNITFSSGNFSYYENGNNFRVPDANTKKINSALVLYHASFGIFENVNFNHIIGEVMSITSSWELRYNKISCTNCSNIEGGLITFKEIDTSLNENANISNIEIMELNFEAVIGQLIKCFDNCRLIDSVINNFHFEPFTCLLEGATRNELTDGKYDETIVKHLGLIEINGGCDLIINNIVLNNIATHYISANGKQYIFDTLFNITSEKIANVLKTAVNNICIQGMKKTFNLILQETNAKKVSNQSIVAIENIINNSAYSCIYNVKYFPTIINKAKLIPLRNQMMSKVNNSFNAFSDYTRNADNDNRRYLYYDASVLNDNLLCVKPITNATTIFANSSMKGNKIYIRAKIETGKTYQLTIGKPDYTKTLTFNLEGTGNYKLYECDMSSILSSLKDNPLIIFYSSSNNTENFDVSLDYFYFE